MSEPRPQDPAAPQGVNPLIWTTFLRAHEAAGSRATMTQPSNDEEALASIQSMMRRNPAPPIQDCSHRVELALTLRRHRGDAWEDCVTNLRQLMNRHRSPAGGTIAELPTQPCNHQAVVNQVLRAATGDSWDNAIAEVNRLWEADQPRPESTAAPTTGTGGGARLFKASDVPEFRKLKDFPSYFNQVRFFLHGQSVPESLCTEAVFTLLSRWTGTDLKNFAQETDASTIARATWVETRQGYLDYLNGKFRGSNDYTQAAAEWEDLAHTLRGRKFNDAIDFYLAFETGLHDYRAACLRNNKDLPSNREETKKFVAALPPSMVDEMLTRKDDFEDQPYDTYKAALTRLWTAMRATGAKIMTTSVKREREEDSEDEAEARPAKRFGPARPRTTDSCRRSWDEAPQELQGSITPGSWMRPEEVRFIKQRWERVKKAGVCARCRQPRSKHALIDTFTPVSAWEEPRVRIAEVKEELSDREE